MCYPRPQALPNRAQHALPATMMSAKQGPVGTTEAVTRSKAIRRKSRGMKVELVKVENFTESVIFESVLGGRESRHHLYRRDTNMYCSSWAMQGEDGMQRGGVM